MLGISATLSPRNGSYAKVSFRGNDGWWGSPRSGDVGWWRAWESVCRIVGSRGVGMTDSGRSGVGAIGGGLK